MIGTADLTAVDRVLCTTRSVRRRLDTSRPVPRELLKECIEIAVQAPSSGNKQAWRFLVVEDPEKRRVLTKMYVDSIELVKSGEADPTGIGYGARLKYADDDPRKAQKYRMSKSSEHFHEIFHQVPTLIMVCSEGRVRPDDPVALNYPTFIDATFYGSVYPAMWSFMLALRSRGLVSCLTTGHLLWEAEAAELLGIPEDVTQVGLLAVAFPIGDEFQVAGRLPGADVTYWDTWGQRD